MDSKLAITVLVVMVILTALPSDRVWSQAAARVPGTETSWSPQALQAWGRSNLAIDFGPLGLWSYSGVWVRLSRLDPRGMAAWGQDYLAVDFGAHGLWTFDGRSWLKITR